jgi:hypothetical protein
MRSNSSPSEGGASRRTAGRNGPDNRGNIAEDSVNVISYREYTIDVSHDGNLPTEVASRVPRSEVTLTNDELIEAIEALSGLDLC